MQKLLCLNPVLMETTKEEEAYLRRCIPDGMELVFDGIQDGPYTIQSEYDEALAQPEILRLCREAGERGVQGIFINCFGDPGVRAAREIVDIPVFGGFEPTMLAALGVADRIAIVSVLDSVVPLLRGNLRRMGIQDRVTCVRTVGIPVAQLGDTEALVQALIRETELAVREDGAEAVVLGCTAMLGVAEATAQGLKSRGIDVPVLETAKMALGMLGFFVSAGLKPSRRTYGAAVYSEHV